MKIHQSDPYYTTASCSEEGFPVRAAPSISNARSDAEASSDPILNHERWSGKFKGCAVELPAGTTSGTLAVRIAKPSNHNQQSGFPALFALEACHGALMATPFYEDAAQWTLIYECPDEVIIHGAVSIAPGITLYGNGAAIILPPHDSSGKMGGAAFADGYGLSREALVMAPEWLVSKGVGAGLIQTLIQWRLDDALLQDLAA